MLYIDLICDKSYNLTCTEVTSTTDNTSAETLDGVLIADNIYGCGNEHSIELKGVTFHWYDRYERRNSENTAVYEYLDINSFTMRYQVYELSPSYYNNDWIVTYDLYSSSSFCVSWKTYDKDGYSRGTSNPMADWLDGKRKGEFSTSGFSLGKNVYYAEFFPFGL